MMSREQLFAELAAVVRSDLDLVARHGRGDPSDRGNALTEVVADYVVREKIVYTAFDGDHFGLRALIRRFVLSRGATPVNPESVLGYLETVTARLVKAEVLLDDLSVLSGCDELWVFTDESPEPPCVRQLAEGVIVELLYFLKRRGPESVKFIRVKSLLDGRGEPEQFSGTYADTKAALGADQQRGVLDLANSAGWADERLRTLVLHVCDPLDFKYSYWLRPPAYGPTTVPLVPSLAVDFSDACSDQDSLGRVVFAWMALARLCAAARVLPPVDGTRACSSVSQLLEAVWRRVQPNGKLMPACWADYPIPKIHKGSCWPLTAKEGGARRD